MADRPTVHSLTPSKAREHFAAGGVLVLSDDGCFVALPTGVDVPVTEISGVDVARILAGDYAASIRDERHGTTLPLKAPVQAAHDVDAPLRPVEVLEVLGIENTLSNAMRLGHALRRWGIERTGGANVPRYVFSAELRERIKAFFEGKDDPTPRTSSACTITPEEVARRLSVSAAATGDGAAQDVDAPEVAPVAKATTKAPKAAMAPVSLSVRLVEANGQGYSIEADFSTGKGRELTPKQAHALSALLLTAAHQADVLNASAGVA